MPLKPLLEPSLKYKDRRHFGNEIEKKAWLWLESLAPPKILLASNFFYRGGEIDLIWKETAPPEAPDLVFCEVRARRPGTQGAPSPPSTSSITKPDEVWVSGIESVTFEKRRKIEKTASLYLSKLSDREVRLYGGIRMDVVEWNGRVFQHWKSAW
jgi:Holliday junction resolvase-like predicted endonuclease